MTERQTVRTARLALLWGALTLAACRGDGGAGEAPRPLSVTPDRGPVSAPVDVVIRGENFHARVTTDFTGSGETGVDARFAVLLGQVPLDGVRLRADGSIAATVPPGLATGSYDLTVVDPEGRSGTLAAAYRVVPDAAAGPPVDSFRIDPLGPQQAMKPFAVAVTALDPQGQPVADFNGSVQLSDLTGTAVPGSAGLFVGGRWSGLVEIRAAHAADVLTASDGLGHSGQSAPFLVLPSPAAGLRFLTPARTGQAGACSGAGQPVVVGLFDAFGAPTQAEAAVPLALAAAPPAGFEVFADPSCAVPAAAVVGAGASSATFWFRGTRAGTVSLTASAPSLRPDSQSQTVVPAPPAAVAFVTTPQTVNAGVCSQAVTVEVQDAFGNPSPPGGAALELAASAGGFALFSDAACSVPASAAAVAPGATQGSFWFRGTTAQLVTVTAGSASLGLSAASQDEIVLSAGSATQLVILTPPQGVPAGTCSDLVTVQAQDSFGNPVQGAGAEQVALSAAPAAGMALFSDAACSVPAAVVQIGAGQSTTSFWFRGTVAGPVAITAGSATLTDAVQTESLTPAPPARLEFATASMNVAAGACSGLATVTVRDAFGNASPSGAPLPVGLAAAPPAGFTFFADALCATPVAQVAVPAGGSTAAFAFRATRAGTETITASAAGLAPASQDETIRAATPDRLVITSAPQSVVAGACSGAVAVQARDPWDNPAPVPAAAAVALSATPVAGFGFFADAACTVPAASVTIPAGQPGATFFFAGTAAGSIAVTASAAGWTPASQSETVGPAAADHLVFLTAPQTVTAGACSGAVTVESRDVYENAAPPAGGAPVSLAGAPGAGLAFHAGAGCAGAPVASVAIAPGASSATFSFRDTAAGSVAVTASSAPLLPVTQTETVNPAAADHLAFTTAPQSRPAGACSAAVALESRDAYDNASPVAAATAIGLSASPGAGFTFYSDAGCTAAATGTAIGAGSSAAGFWFKGTAPGNVTATASVAGWSPSPAQDETITPAAADHVSFTTGPQTVTAGACSGVVTVETRDAYENASPVAAGTSIALAASPAAGFAFYSDAGCTAAAASATIPAGASSASFWFRGTAAGGVTVTASVPGLSPSPSQLEAVEPAAPDHLVFATPPQTRPAGACSAVVTLESQDAFGNVSRVAAATAVALSASPAAGFAFYSDAGCTLSTTSIAVVAGASSTGFWFKGTVPGGVTVTATASGLSPSPAQVETVIPAAADHLVFASAPQAVAAGGCSGAVTVESRDALGNVSTVAAATAVALSASPAAGFAFYADAGCTLAAGSATIPAGSSSAVFWFRGTAAGTVSVTASAAGWSPSPTQAETVAPAPPDRIAFASPPQTVTAGQCSAQVTLEARDQFGNPSAVAGATAVSLSASPAAGFAFFADAACSVPAISTTVAAGASTATFHFMGTAAGPVTATATPAGLAAATQVETVTAAATPSQLVFLTAPQAVTAGACSGTLTVETRDSYGNPRAPAGGATVSLSAPPAAGVQFYAGTDTTCAGAPVAAVSIPDGSATADFHFKGTAAGSTTVTAASAPLNPAAQVETVNPAAPDHLVFTTGAQTRQAGACSAAVTVQSQDAYGNVSAVAGATAVGLSAAPAAGFGFYSDAGCTVAAASATIAAGSSTASFWFKGTAPGNVTVTASVGGWSPSPTQVATITPAAADHLVFTTGPQTVTAGACSGMVTVQSQDAYGNVSSVAAATTVDLSASPAAGFTFYSDAGCTAAAPSTTIAAGSSAAGFWFKGTVSGSVTVTASVTGWSPSPTQVETVNPAAPDHLVFTTPAQTRQAGACSALVTLQGQDPFGNVSSVAAATVVDLSASPATGFGFYSDAACATAATARTIAAGASTATFYFKGTAPGSVTVTASVAGWSPSPTQVETVNPAPPDHLAFGTASQTVTAGACSAAATVESRDPYGNVSPVSAATAVNLSAAPAAGFAFYSDPACTSAVALVTIPAAGTVATFYFRGTAAGSVTVAAAAAGMSPSPTQVETVVPAAPDRLVFTSAPQTLQAGACSAAATLLSRDAFGNTAPVSAATAVDLLAAPAAGFGFYADPACSVPAATASLAAGQSAASMWFRGTAVGAFTVTASVAGWTGSATQVETVNPGDPDHFAWDAFASPQASNIPFAVTVRALDAFGNATAFAGTAALTLSVSPPLAPAPVVTCTSGCIAGNTTGPFTAGVWTGSVAVGSPATPEPPGTPDRSLVATSGAVTGQSAAFALQGAKNPSPPVARFTTSPVVIRANQSVSFDASGSYDYETPVTLLEVSWDFQGTATAVQPPGAAPWTAWSTTKTASNTYTTAGTYTPRLAVRDEAGAVSYATVRVVVLAVGGSLCVVNTAADVDDGASSCACTGAACGTDGNLSLAEALRLSADGTTITFAGPMTITGSGSYTISRNVQILAPPGVVLDSKSFLIQGGDSGQPLVLAGLEFTRQTTPIFVSSKRFVVFEDVYFHDLGTAGTPAVEDRGTVTLTRVRMANCASTCLLLTDSSNSDLLTVRHSDFKGNGGAGTAIEAQQCKSGRLALSVQSNAFSGFAQAVRMGAACPGFTAILNNTFEANGSGLVYAAGASPNHVLRNNVFTNQTAAAASCGGATFANRDYHVLFGNASDGCLAGDPNALAADPQYVFPAARDYRLQLGSPAVDSAVDLGLYLMPGFPAAPGPRFMGAGPDRGGRESF